MQASDVSNDEEHVGAHGGAWFEETARGARDQPYRNFEWRVGTRAVSNGIEAFTSLQIDARRSLWYLQNLNQSNIRSGDANDSGLCSVKLLNDGGCRSRTHGRWLGDVRGSTAKGYGGYCDGRSDVEKGVTLIKTRLLRKCQSSSSDTMLNISIDTSCWIC